MSNQIYSVTGDFPNQIVHDSVLIKEILESSITTSLIGLNVIGDVCTITFTSALSGGEITTLNTVVSNHQGNYDLLPEEITYLLSDTIDELSGTGVSIETVLIKDGLVDGRDISVDGSNLDSHILLTSGVHGVTGNVVGTTDTQTLTNKTLTSPIIAQIINSGTITLPTSTDTLVGRNTTDTLTNKTLTSPIISQIINTGTLTLPTSTDTLVGRNTTDTMTNKTMTAASNTIAAAQLRTTGANVVINTAAPPSSGNVLTATSATTATWQTPSSSLPTCVSVTDDSFITTTSGSHILAAGMTITPAAGTYAVIWCASVSNTGASDLVYIQIYAGGVAQGSEIRFMRGDSSTDNDGGLTATAKVAVNGSQAIEGRWREIGGTGEMRGRNLLIIQVSP